MQRALAVAVTMAVAWAAQADLLVDNYLSEDDYDHRTALSAERNTIISDSWTVDDGAFEASVVVQKIRWIGAREAGEEYPKADFILLDDDFNIVQEIMDVEYTLTERGEDFGGLLVYEGEITLEGIELAPGHYYFGARLVGTDGLGRNFLTTTGDGQLQGSMGYFRSIPLGFPDWTSVDEVLSIGASDFAFQIEGEVVPEPTSLALVGFGALMMGLRRRSLGNQQT